MQGQDGHNSSQYKATIDYIATGKSIPKLEIIGE